MSIFSLLSWWQFLQFHSWIYFELLIFYFFFFVCCTKSELNTIITSFEVIATCVQALLNSSLNFKALFYPVFRKSPINKAEGSNPFLAHQCRDWCRRLRFCGVWGLFRACFARAWGGSAVAGRKWREEEPCWGSGPSWGSPRDLWGHHGAGREEKRLLLPNPAKGKKTGLYTTHCGVFWFFFFPPFVPALTLSLC